MMHNKEQRITYLEKLVRELQFRVKDLENFRTYYLQQQHPIQPQFPWLIPTYNPIICREQNEQI